MGACSVDGCGKKTIARGLCWNHYARLRAHGDPLKGRRRAGNGEGKKWIEDNSNYDGGECLIWPFSDEENNKVGRVLVDGEFLSSYRYMCIIAHGPPTPGKNNAAHSCGKRHEGCVSPKHLRWATHAENMGDKILHGTHPRGEACYNSKLDENSVKFIKRNAGKIKNRAMASMFDVHEVTIGQIIAGKRWAHIDISD